VAAVPDANTPKAPNPPEDPRHSDPTYWKHRFEAVAGRLRAREDEHKAAIGTLRQENDQLRTEILRLQQATPTSTPQATINLAEFFTPEQIKNLGEDEGLVQEYHRHLLAGGAPRTGTLPGARRLTVAESALIQTFPEGMVFAGPRSAQYHQVGDAVPPKLAAVMGRALVWQLRGMCASSREDLSEPAQRRLAL
jgi:site-specific DNA-cytosine methylase